MSCDGTSAPALPSYWSSDLPSVRQSFLALIDRHPAVDAREMQRALDYVEASHRGQVRKGTDAPYAVHPIRLASFLVDTFGIEDADVLRAALFHDVLEETSTSQETLAREFSPRCAALVSALTRLPGEARPAGGDPPDSPYLARVRRFGDDAVLVKMADKIDNLRDATNHPDRARVGVFVDETFTSYVPLARALTDPRQARLAERFLLEAAGRAGGGTASPRFLAALKNTLDRALETATDAHGVLADVPMPRLAADLYLYLNSEARAWLEFDGVSLSYERVSSRELARRMCSNLRRTLAGDELPRLLGVAGIPPAFASRSTEEAWRQSASSVAAVQRALFESRPSPWFEVLLQDGHEAALLAAIQSCIYFTASRRSPLWTVDLGAVYSRRMDDVAPGRHTGLVAFALRHRLALRRYADRSGTARRAGYVFLDPPRGLPDAALWALRFAVESLQPGETTALDALWGAVHDRPFEAASLPPRECVESETIGFRETEALFLAAGAQEQFARLTSVLTRDLPPAGVARWIEYDAEEWRKRSPRWSQPGQLAIPGDEIENLEEHGVRVLRRRFGDTELLTVLPARKFALQDRLPELAAGDLRYIEREGFTAVSMFDRLILDAPARGRRWTPRVYRILDTIADLDPSGVQTLVVDYDESGALPKLEAYLPLPQGQDPRQEERKSFVARYIAAQVYNCALVRRVHRAAISASVTAERRRLHAFRERELLDALSRAEAESGLRSSFGTYIEQYGFDAFGITGARPAASHFRFGPNEMRSGTYVGIDIGGQRIKIAVIRNGELLDNPSRPEIATPSGITVAEFCQLILHHVAAELRATQVSWRDVGGIGISWPGGVRDNRIAAISRVLSGLSDAGEKFTYHDRLERLGRFDFLPHFGQALAAMRVPVKDDLAWALLNDGDAEAFGNHALRVLKGVGRAGGKIFVKLGTSLAGGRVTAEGAVAEDVAEFSKVVLNLTATVLDDRTASLARNHVSAEGVRNLSRTFALGDTPLFGERDGSNQDSSRTRIEPFELGKLLPLLTVDDETAFLDALITADNVPENNRVASVIASTAAALKTARRPALIEYIRERGADLGREPPGWTTGLRRTLWLVTGVEAAVSSDDGTLPDDFPYEATARAVVGSVALFSQLGLHVAHLIAQLYNIYRRGTFSEVVLAGGVLTGRSGEIVERQAKGFLARYYDKIYGPGRPLGPETLVRAGSEGIANPGVFGAAMAANRERQLVRFHLLARTVEEHLAQFSIGEEIAIEDVLALAEEPVARDHVLQLLDEHFVKGTIARTSGDRIQRIA